MIAPGPEEIASGMKYVRNQLANLFVQRHASNVIVGNCRAELNLPTAVTAFTIDQTIYIGRLIKTLRRLNTIAERALSHDDEKVRKRYRKLKPLMFRDTGERMPVRERLYTRTEYMRRANRLLRWATNRKQRNWIMRMWYGR